MSGPAWKEVLCDHVGLDKQDISGSLLLSRCIEKERTDDTTYDISASIVELYNEQVCHTISALTGWVGPCKWPQVSCKRIAAALYARAFGDASWKKAAGRWPRKNSQNSGVPQLCLADLIVRRVLIGGLMQVWDLLAPGGKQELELAKSIGGFDIPDLTQIGKALLHGTLCLPVEYSWLVFHTGSCAVGSHVTAQQRMSLLTTQTRPQV